MNKNQSVTGEITMLTGENVIYNDFEGVIKHFMITEISAYGSGNFKIKVNGGDAISFTQYEKIDVDIHSVEFEFVEDGFNSTVTSDTTFSWQGYQA